MTKESTIQRNVVRLIITRGGHAIVTRCDSLSVGGESSVARPTERTQRR